MNELWQELIKPEHKLLDIGCWNGQRILELKDKCNVYGMDIDESKFEGADESIKPNLFQGDIIQGLECGEQFDFVLLRDVIEHLYGEVEALENINAVMNDGGYLVLSTPKFVRFFNWYDPAWIRWNLGGKEPHRHFKKKDLFNLLHNCGFEVKHYHTEGTLRWVVSRWINGFSKYVLRSKWQIKSDWELGHFEWVVVAKKK